MNSVPSPNKAGSIRKPEGYVTAPRAARTSYAPQKRSLSAFNIGVPAPLSFPKNKLSEPIATRQAPTANRSVRHGAKTT